jgi:hypothetical protein
MNQLYNAASRAQYQAHRHVLPLLHASLSSILSALPSSPNNTESVSISFLGSAQGANDLRTLSTMLSEAACTHAAKPPYLVFFNDQLSSSSTAALAENVSAHVLSHEPPLYKFAIAPGSFYDSLFPPACIDLSISMIAFHWMPSIPSTLPASCSVHEENAPALQRKEWRDKHRINLTNFLQHRAEELKDNAYGVYLGTGGLGGIPSSQLSNESHCPAWSEFERPPLTPGESIIVSALKRSMRESNSFPQDAIKKCHIPYFRFVAADIEAAVAAVPDLELLDVNEFFIHMGQGEPTPVLADLFWSIVETSVRASVFGSPPQSEEAHVDECMRALYAHVRDVICDQFEDDRGAFVPYIAFRVRRREREPREEKRGVRMYRGSVVSGGGGRKGTSL